MRLDNLAGIESGLSPVSQQVLCPEESMAGIIVLLVRHLNPSPPQTRHIVQPFVSQYIEFGENNMGSRELGEISLGRVGERVQRLPPAAEVSEGEPVHECSRQYGGMGVIMS
jgi:hypothetical protein